VPIDVVRRAYTGVAITFDRAEGFERSPAEARGTWRYLRPILGQSRTLARVLTTSVLIRLLALALPLLTGLVVDQIVPQGDHRLLLVVAAVVGAVIGYHFHRRSCAPTCSCSSARGWT
jgi:ATP-binding cassette subfamily B protein